MAKAKAASRPIREPQAWYRIKKLFRIATSGRISLRIHKSLCERSQKVRSARIPSDLRSVLIDQVIAEKSYLIFGVTG